MNAVAYQRLLDRLSEHGSKILTRQGHATAQCPAHEDRQASLSLRHIEGSALLHCHAGCTVDDILDALHLGRTDLYDEPAGARYRYDDGRTVVRTPDKRFRQTGHTPGHVELYRRTKLSQAVADEQPVYLVEGEKDVHALESLGAVATTAPMGATNFAKVDVTPLTGAHIIVIPDQDEAGNRWLHDVLDKVIPIAASLAARAPKVGKDAADHIGAGYGLADLLPVSVAGRRTAVLTPSTAITVRPVHWLWAGRIPAGSMSLIAGREGIGKTTVAYQLAADITRGRLPGEHHGTPKAVIVAATEDSWEHTIVPRLMAAGADLARIYRVAVITPGGVDDALSLPVDLAELGRCIDQVDAALVLLDPLMSRLDAKLDAHRDGEVRQALEPLVALAQRHAAVVLGIIHVNKSSGGDALTRIMASRAFTAVARAVLFVLTDPDDEAVRLLGQVKNNLGRLDLPTLTFRIDTALVADTDEGPVTTGRIVWGPETDRSINDTLGIADEDTEARSAVAEAGDWLTDWLASLGGSDDSANVKKAGAKAGHSDSALKRARRRLRIEVTAEGFPRRTYWSIAGTQPATQPALPAASESSGVARGGTAPTDPTDPTGTGASRAGARRETSKDGLTTTTPRGYPAQSGQLGQSDQPPARAGRLDDPSCSSCGQPLSEQYTALGRTTHPVCPKEPTQ